MEKGLTKTDRFLNLFMELLSSPKGYIDDDQFREILGRPSKSQYHKYIIDLTHDKEGRRGSLERKKVNGTYVYRLRESVFQTQPLKQDRPKLVLLSQQNYAEIKVFDSARQDFAANNQIPRDLIRQGDDYDYYHCRFEDEEELLHKIFPYADNLEILAPESLKKAFIKKAQKATFINMSQHVVGKKAA
jgi:hypothetical protein